MSTSEKILDTLMVPAFVGALGGLGASYFLKDFETMKLFGQDFSPAVGYGLTIGGASLVSEVAGQWILPILPQSVQASEFQSKAVGPVLTGASALALLYATDKNSFNRHWKTVGALGVGAQIGGKYVADAVVPMISA